MGLHVVSDGALGGSRLQVDGVGGWLSAFRAGPVLSFFRDFVATVRDAILRRASGSGAARIRVAAMSHTWLRMHEVEYDKRRGQL